MPPAALDSTFRAAFGGDHPISFAPTPWQVLNDRKVGGQTPTCVILAHVSVSTFLLRLTAPHTLTPVAPQALYDTQIKYTQALRARARFLLALSVLTLCTVGGLVRIMPCPHAHKPYTSASAHTSEPSTGGPRGVHDHVGSRVHEGVREELRADDRRHEQLCRYVVARCW